MPNWCNIDVVIEGDKTQLKDLYNTMCELQEMPGYGLVENGFGNTWLGNLVHKLGADWHDVRCRGEWRDVYIEDDGTLRIIASTAWTPPYELFRFLEDKYTGINVYYYAEEPGIEIFETNDAYGAYFDSKYVIDVYVDDGAVSGMAYANSLEGALKIASDYIGKEMRSIADLEAYNLQWRHEDSDNIVLIHEIKNCIINNNESSK